MRYIKHLIEIFKYVIVIFIDYTTNLSIVYQITLFFNNTNKLNLHLIQVFIYLFQFRIDVYYYFNKRYIILNVLFRLLIEKKILNKNENLKLKSYYNNLKNLLLNNQNYIYNKIFINMLSMF